MPRKVVAIWMSLVMVFGFIAIVDTTMDFVPTAKGATLYVNETGSGGAYTKIQDAIDAANPGDMVFVYNGTYYENVIVNKIINMTGEDMNTTIIDGGGVGFVVSVIVDYVNISGFTIMNSGAENFPNWDAGLELDHVNYCNIYYNNITQNNEYGLTLDYSNNNNIIANIISNNDHSGFYSRSSSDNNISFNSCCRNYDGVGISLAISSNRNLVAYNNISNNYVGTSQGSSSSWINYSNNEIYSNSLRGINIGDTAGGNNYIIGNNIYENGDGISLSSTSPSNIIVENNIYSNTGNGIYLISSDNNKILNNNVTFNDKDGFQSTSTANNNITGNNFSSNKWVGIRMFSSSDDNTLMENSISSNNMDGIEITLSSNNRIIYNNIFSNVEDGIYLLQSHYNNIDNNFILNNTNGISLYSSDYNNISYQNISNNTYGIFLITSYVNNIYKNNISNNQDGIGLDTSNGNNITNNIASLNIEEGIDFESSNGNSIIGNDVYLNIGIGIRFSNSNENDIVSNNISNNSYGIHISSSSNNSIYHNKLIENVNQAYDFQYANYWDDGYPSGGNYWPNYGGVDNFKGPNQDQPGSDGIGDTPYVIDADSQDNYPLMNPYTKKPIENYSILYQGWNLISIPLIQDNQNLSKVLEMIDGWYDAVQWYSKSDPNDPWKHHKVSKSIGVDLFHLNETMSFWIHITKPGDTIFLYNGTQATSNQTIQLHPGWNMVGYPSLSNHNRTAGLNNLEFGVDVDTIQWFDAATKTWHFMGPDDSFVPGRGYWVHAKVEAGWEVPL